MQFEQDVEAAQALYYASLGAAVAKYAADLEPAALCALSEQKATRVLTQVYAVLRDDALNDNDCFLKIDEILRVFFRELELRTNRHSECE